MMSIGLKFNNTSIHWLRNQFPNFVKLHVNHASITNGNIKSETHFAWNIFFKIHFRLECVHSLLIERIDQNTSSHWKILSVRLKYSLTICSKLYESASFRTFSTQLFMLMQPCLITCMWQCVFRMFWVILFPHIKNKTPNNIYMYFVCIHISSYSLALLLFLYEFIGFLR